MKVCKIKPARNVCLACTDRQISQNSYKACEECLGCKTGCELISVGTSWWFGDYAMVVKNGVVQKVELSRVFDIKER